MGVTILLLLAADVSGIVRQGVSFAILYVTLLGGSASLVGAIILRSRPGRGMDLPTLTGELHRATVEAVQPSTTSVRLRAPGERR